MAIQVPQNSQEFKAMIDNYKRQNPVKYASKRASLEAKLKAMEAAEGIPQIVSDPVGGAVASTEPESDEVTAKPKYVRKPKAE